jgi:hypothetical protein
MGKIHAKREYIWSICVHVYDAKWPLALLMSIILHFAIYSLVLPLHYEPDGSEVVAPSTELVLVPPVGGMLVVVLSPPRVAIIEVRLPSILSRALATKLSWMSAELLSPSFTASQPSRRSILAWLNDSPMAVKFPPSRLVVLLPAVPPAVVVGLGRPCIVPSDAFVASVLAVLLDIPIIVAAAPVPLVPAGEHALCIDDIIVSLPLPTAALLPPPPTAVVSAVFVALLPVVAWEDSV